MRRNANGDYDKKPINKNKDYGSALIRLLEDCKRQVSKEMNYGSALIHLLKNYGEIVKQVVNRY
jgi:hypothetical protein